MSIFYSLLREFYQFGRIFSFSETGLWVPFSLGQALCVFRVYFKTTHADKQNRYTYGTILFMTVLSSAAAAPAL